MGQVYNKIFSPEKWEKVNQKNKDIIDDYITELRARKKSVGTIKQYNSDLRQFAIYIMEACDNVLITELTRKDVRRFLLHLTDTYGVSNARANRIMSSVRTLMNYLEEDEEDYEDYRSASSKIKGLPKESVREIQFLDNVTILSLYKKFEKEERWRDCLLLGILYDSGARKNEIAQIRRDSISKDKHVTNIVVGKRGKKFPILVWSLSLKHLDDYNKWRGEDDCELLFITGHDETARNASADTIYGWVTAWRKDIKEITGIDSPINVHTFRHSFINNLLHNKDARQRHYLIDEMGLGEIPLEKIKILVHHENAETTLSYADNDEEKELEELFGVKLS